MKIIRKYSKLIKLKLRKNLNPILAPLRRYIGGIKQPFSIISNNCWGGKVYQYYNLPYDSPTVGLYFYAEDYIKFVNNLKYYISQDLTFISYKQSKYKDDIVRKNQISKPIGILGDVEIIFLHYNSEDEAKEKWNRRKKRIHWDNLFIKFSEMNQCTIKHLKQFDELKTDNKLMFVSQDYGFLSQVIVKSFVRSHEVYDDTTNFKEGIFLSRWLKRLPYKK